MECPHCLVSIHGSFGDHLLPSDSKGHWFARVMVCPNCQRRAHHSEDAESFNLKLEKTAEEKEATYSAGANSKGN